MNKSVFALAFVFFASVGVADTITISCVRDDNTTNEHVKKNFEFVFDETSSIGEIRWQHIRGWGSESASVERTEREIILTSVDEYGVDRYWISRTELKVTVADPRITFEECSMKKEETKEKLY